MSPVAGLPAFDACLSHFNLMVKDKSQLFPSGPPVVKAALGYDISKEDLGGDHIHVKQSRSVENLANDEGHAFELIRRFLSYLSSNVWEVPPRGETGDDPNRHEENLLSLIPRNPRQIDDPKLMLQLIVDQESLFEIAPWYGRLRFSGLARLHGYPVGVMANDPRHHGGATAWRPVTR